MTDVDGSEIADMPAPSRRRFKVILPGLVVLMVVVAGVFLFLTQWPHGPVPHGVQKAVTFKIYYPKQRMMPTGYHLDTTSFRSPETGVVLFSVSYGNARSMVFSETEKPAGDVLDKFNSSAIPVHTQINTSLGKALVGAYGEGKSLRTVASLPITNGPWLIVTAPSDVSQTDLGKILNALTR